MAQSSYFRRVIRVVLGMFIGSFSFYMMVKADIGLSPWDVFCMGLSYHLPITYGQALVVVAVITLALALAMKEQIGVGSIIDAILVGNLVDFYTMLDPLPKCETVWGGMALMTAGLFLMGLAQMIYMKAGLSCGPRDALVVAIGKRMRRLPIGVAQWVLQGSALVAGIFLGGPVGVGTVLSAFGVGVAVQIVFNLGHFEPRDVHHESLFETARILRERSAAKRS